MREGRAARPEQDDQPEFVVPDASSAVIEIPVTFRRATTHARGDVRGDASDATPTDERMLIG